MPSRHSKFSLQIPALTACASHCICYLLPQLCCITNISNSVVYNNSMHLLSTCRSPAQSCLASGLRGWHRFVPRVSPFPQLSSWQWWKCKINERRHMMPPEPQTVNRGNCDSHLSPRGLWNSHGLHMWSRGIKRISNFSSLSYNF